MHGLVVLGRLWVVLIHGLVVLGGLWVVLEEILFVLGEVLVIMGKVLVLECVLERWMHFQPLPAVIYLSDQICICLEVSWLCRHLLFSVGLPYPDTI